MNENLPSWINIARAENNLFAERCAGLGSIERWAAYENAAQLVLGYLQDLPPDTLSSLYEVANAAPILATARIFDSAAMEHYRAYIATTTINQEPVLKQIHDSALLQEALRNPSNQFASRIRAQLREDTRSKLDISPKQGDEAVQLETSLLEDINNIIRGPSLWNPPFPDPLPENAATLHTSFGASDSSRQNRILLEAAFPDALLEDNLAQDLRETVVAYTALAALSYSSAGNFASAAAVLRRSLDLVISSHPLIVALMASAAPALLGDFYRHAGSAGKNALFLEALAYFLKTGTKDSESQLFEAHLNLRQMISMPFHSSVWLTSLVVLRQVVNLSTARVLRQFHNIDSEYIDRILSSGLTTLLPTQHVALTSTGLIQNRSNAVLCLPTSTGKTLLAEIAIITSTDPGRIGVFVVPYVALGRQIADRIAERLPKHWQLKRMFGGYSEPTSFDLTTQSTFIVATPERVDALLRSQPGILKSIDCIVFDEAHIIGSGDRGMRVEGLITRLRLRQLAGESTRLILVSAVVPNASEIAKWISAPPQNLVTSNWASGSRRLCVWSPGQLTWYHSGDPLTPEGTSPSKPIAQVPLPWPNTFQPQTYDFAETKFLEPQDTQNLAFLIEYFWNKYQEPILCVCATREMTRRVAAAAKSRFPVVARLGQYVERAIALISRRYRHCLQLKLALRTGVAYHNASLPHELRSILEDAAAAKELRVVIATTTLAEGIDLPFRVTILSDWLCWREGKQEPLPPLLLRNIAGRCGRAGSFTEGDVVIYDSPLGDRTYKAWPVRSTGLRRVLFSEGDKGLVSSVVGNSVSVGVLSVMASQFLAAVVENPDEPALENVFAGTLFSGFHTKQDKIASAIDSISKELCDSEWQLAARNSPLRTTSLGQAVSSSGFSPSSTRRIAAVLGSNPDLLEDIAVLSCLLLQLGDLPEQPQIKFRKLVAHLKSPPRSISGRSKRAPRFPVQPQDLPLVIRLWLEGATPIDIFVQLPTVRRSARKMPLSEWIAGLQHPTTWDEEFDVFCDFLNSVLSDFLPWLLRACELLSPHLQQCPQLVRWNDLAMRLRRDEPSTSSPSPSAPF